MKFILLICFALTLISCSSSNSSTTANNFDMVDLIIVGRDDFSEMKKSLENQQVAKTFYLMYVHDSIARLINLEIRNEGTYFLDVKCDISENNVESFTQFTIPEKIKVTGIVKTQNIEVSNSLILRGLTTKSTNYILEKEKLDEINVAGVLSFNMKNCEAFK